MKMTRRALITGAAALMARRPSGAAVNIRFGLDMYSLGSQNWTPVQMLDYCKKWNVKMAHFSEIRFIGGLEPDNLKKVRAYADQLGIDLELGTRSICPTSAMFDKAQGTAEEQIAKMVDAAKIVRSPIVRCVLGSSADRRAPGIESHIDSMIKVLRNSRSRIMDAGLHIAIENHAGDMQARELKTLIEGAGKEYVGVCLDSGNPVWTLEDPHLTLETLAPYVQTSHFRDSYVQNTPQGIAVAWTRMGDGNIGMEDYIKKYIQLCPGKAISLEVIVGGARVHNYADPAFWENYKSVPAWEFSRFLALANKGAPRPEVLPAPRGGRGAAAPPPATGAGRGPSPAAINLEHVDASIKWTQDFLAKL
jgi:sugar phosphate isomerase/epimerase